MKRWRSALVIAFVVLLATSTGQPAWAAALTGVSLGAPTGQNFTGLTNTQYDLGFTTATSRSLSRVSTTLPTGTSATGTRFLTVNGTGSNFMTTPDTAVNSIATGLDVRARIQVQTVPPGSGGCLFGKYTTASQKSWLLCFNADASFSLGVSTTGSNSIFAQSVQAVPFTSGETFWLRATYRADNGTSKAQTDLYTSPDGTTWNLLRSVVGASVNPIFDGTDPLIVGSEQNTPFVGRIYAAEVRNGIDGPVVNRFDPADMTTTPASWTSSSPQGETWTQSRSGTRLPVDVGVALSVRNVTGVPAGGWGEYRLTDNMASYAFPASTVNAGVPCTVSFVGFTNAATATDHNATVITYTAGTLATSDSATAGTFSIISGLSSGVPMTAVVAPAFIFTVTGSAGICNGVTPTVTATADTIALGALSPSAATVAAQILTVTTNAGSGFTVQLRGSAPTAARALADVAGGNTSPAPFTSGEGFGYLTNDGSLAGGAPDRFTVAAPRYAALTAAQDPVFDSTTAGTSLNACVAYRTGVTSATPAGTYVGSLIYTAVPSF